MTAGGAGPAVEGYDGLSFLARGGTATVYRAMRAADGDVVAIKVFDAPAAKAFDRQVRAAETLRGVPGVLAVDDVGRTSDGRPFLVSPLVPGGSLADHLLRTGPMPFDQVAEIGAGLARTLSAAHAAGVLHRDLKPSNLLLRNAHEALITDFGAATSVEPAASSDTLSMTVMYSAPEVLEGARPDPRSDVYSLGATLYAMALGQHPLGPADSGALAKLVGRICTTGLPDPASSGVSGPLGAVIRSAVEVDPDRRTPDAGALAEALAAVMAGGSVAEVVEAVPAGTVRRPRRWGATRARVAAAVLAAAVVLAGGVSAVRARHHGRSDVRVDALASLGDPVTRANGVLGPLYRQKDQTFVGLLTRPCRKGERLVELSTHAGPADYARGVSTPWEAVSGDGVGVFVSWMPCATGVDEARYTLAADGRWFVYVARLPEAEYRELVAKMRANETSPSPDYTVDAAVLRTLADPDTYAGWATIDVHR